MKTKAKKRTREKAAHTPRRAVCEHHCYHLMDGYLHGRDVPPGMVKEQCCHCSGTRVIPREECVEIAREERERSHGYEPGVSWRLTEPCRRTRVTFDAGGGKAA
jgi:hypothetical protein